MKPRLVRLLHENWVALTSFFRILLPEVLFPNHDQDKYSQVP